MQGIIEEFLEMPSERIIPEMPFKLDIRVADCWNAEWPSP